MSRIDSARAEVRPNSGPFRTQHEIHDADSESNISEMIPSIDVAKTMKTINDDYEKQTSIQF